ncbi:MAG: hypothetical protein ABEI52_02725, partial [Halobacteriaceae archaeon]
GVYGAREIAGVLGGLAIPAVLLGIFTVLPAPRVQRAAAAVGGAVAILGVGLFRYTYPGRWYAVGGVPTSMTLFTVFVYASGMVVCFWCLFTAIATFKTRNDPGGTVSLTFVRGGEQQTVQVAGKDAETARSALSSVGVMGNVDPGDSPRPTRSTSDGGKREADLSSPLDEAEIMEDRPSDTVDEYCGNCKHFQYIRKGGGIKPYCNAHDEIMDDMEPCQRWEPNN